MKHLPHFSYLGKRHAARVRATLRTTIRAITNRLWFRAFAPAIGVLLLGLLGATFTPDLSRIQHVWALGGWFTLFIVAFTYALTRLPLITRNAILRNTERTLSLNHRPLSPDNLSEEQVHNSYARSLWQYHNDTLLQSLTSLSTSSTRDKVIRLAGFVFILALIGFFTTAFFAPSMREYIANGFTLPAPQDHRVQAWITPPAYTNLPLTPLVQTHTTVPEGSSLTMHLHGSGGVLTRDGTRLQPAGPRRNDLLSWQIPLSHATTLTLRNPALHLTWQVDTQPDAQPSAALTVPLRTTPAFATAFSYRILDDYGITEAHISIAPTIEEAPPLIIPLTFSPNTEITNTLHRDLTPHIWAGTEVEVRIHATDAANQEGVSIPYLFTLAERTFTNKLAAQIVALRKRMLREGEPAYGEVIQGLDTLTDESEIPTTPFFGLRLARHQLAQHDAATYVPTIASLLWTIATDLEDGGVSTAREKMRNAYEALAKALNEGASDEELGRLIHELRQAYENFARQLARNPSESTTPSSNPNNSTFNHSMQQLLDRVRDLARTGARDQARELLQQFANAMENSVQSRLAQDLDALHDTLARQRELQKQTEQHQRNQSGEQQPEGQQSGQQQGGHQQGRQQQGRQQQGGQQQGGQQQGGHQQGGQQQGGQQQGGQQQGGQQQGGHQQGGQQPGGQFSEQSGGQNPNESARSRLSRQQREIQQELQRQRSRGLGKQVPGVGKNLSEAERNMGDAARALGEGNLDEARRHQQQALKNLGKAVGKSMQALRDAMRQQARPGDVPPNAEPGSGGISTGGVKVPDEEPLRRARFILDELQRRAADRTRSHEERRYLNRLLETF